MTTRTPEKREADYFDFYDKVENEVKDLGLIHSIMDVCSVALDRTGKDSVINVEILIPTSSATKEVITRFDKYCKDFGFEMVYTNLSGKVNF